MTATPPVHWQTSRPQTRPSVPGKRTAVDWATTTPTSSTSLAAGRIAVYVLLSFESSHSRLNFDGSQHGLQVGDFASAATDFGYSASLRDPADPYAAGSFSPPLSFEETRLPCERMLTLLGRLSSCSVSSPRAHQARGERARIRIRHDARDVPRPARSITRGHSNCYHAVFGTTRSGGASNTAEWSTCAFRCRSGLSRHGVPDPLAPWLC